MKYEEIIELIKSKLKQIVVLGIVVAVLSFLMMFFVVPIKYQSQTSLLPPEESSSSGLGQLLGIGDVSDFIGIGSSNANAQLYAEIIKSRTCTEKVIQNLNLFEFFDTDDLQLATERLNKLIDVEVTKERILILSVTLSTGYFSRFSDEVDSVAALSARTANEFIIVLDEINREKLNQKAKNTRLFIEQQLETTKEKLKLAEDSLLNFQKVNKTISIPEQLQASLDNAAGIKSEILFTEIKLNTLDYNMLETSPEYLSLQKKLKVLNETYNNLITRESGKENDFLPAFEDVPQLAIELARLTREVKVQNELYLLLQKQFYKERIQENKDIPTVQVLDAAIVPMRPVSPRLFFSTFFIFVAALFLISSYYIFLETRKINKEKNS
ncbi:MAG: hypothetical protein K8F36_03605 [Melioribacteraceae bacterium]|nr:hypothetical protein [Melioribacteraceae bacterium]